MTCKTRDINECDYFSISLTSGSSRIYIKPGKKSVNTFQYFDRVIEDSDCLNGDEIEFRVEVTRNIFERHICESH